MSRVAIKKSFAKLIQFRAFSYRFEFELELELPKLEEPSEKKDISGSEHIDMLEVMYIMNESKHD